MAPFEGARRLGTTDQQPSARVLKRCDPAPMITLAAEGMTRTAESRTGKLVWLLFSVVPLVVAGQGTGMGLIDPWWNFALGRLMLQQRQLITSDPFSFTPTTSAINQQWLAQLLWAIAFDSAGALGAFVLRGAAVAITAIGLWSIGRTLGASRRALVAATLLSAVLIASNLGVRAQTLAFPIAASSLWALQRSGRMKWLVIPLAVVWANIHGSFPLAVAFTGTFALGSLFTRDFRLALDYAVLTVATAFATVLTPYGAEVWHYTFDLSSNDLMRSMLSEWAPTSWQLPTGKAFFAEVAAFGVVLALRRPSMPITWLILVAGLAVFGLMAVRNIVWLGLVGLPVWAILLDRSFAILADHPTRRRTIQLMLVALLGIALVPAFPGRLTLAMQPGNDVASPEQEETLADLASYLTAHQEGRLFHDADWGAYLEAHVGPTQKIFIDTRFEVHPTSVWDDYFAVASARYDWQTVLDRYAIERVATNPDRTPMLSRALDQSGAWQQVWRSEHHNERIVVWQRSGEGAARLTTGHIG